jgi:hypothetical protein
MLAVSVALTLACAGIAAAQASAATITVGVACVVNPDPASGSPVMVTGAGFTPGDPIALQTTAGGGFGNATADANGNFTVTITAPILSTTGPSFSPFTLTATDDLNPLPATPTATFDVANLAVATNPMEAKPSKRVTWSFSGFDSGAEIYVHYLHGKKVVATKAFGRASGTCGTLKTKKVFFPGKAKYDSYRVQVDDSRHYSAKSLPHWVATLRTHIPL